MKTPPYDFVLEALFDMKLRQKPMFGCQALYVGEKIVFILREKPDAAEDNGVWLATTPEHHASLQSEFPNMRSIAIFGPGVTGWQVLPVDADDFEESVLRACELVRRGDERIGKVPKSRGVRARGVNSRAIQKKKKKKKRTLRTVRKVRRVRKGK
jgi:hypothetical protein